MQPRSRRRAKLAQQGRQLLLALALCAACSERLEVLRAGVPPADDGGDDAQRPEARLPRPVLRFQFDEGAGNRVLDSSEEGPLTHLIIEDPSAVTWTPDGLRLDRPTRLSSAQPPAALIERCVRSDQLSVAVWIVPAETVVHGTHRIVSLSRNLNSRNFTLGQGGLNAEPPVDAFMLRVRTTESGGNGLPNLSSGPGVARARLTHLVGVHAADGTERLYVDGQLVAEGTRAGRFANWDTDMRLGVGDEFNTDDPDRAWLGELRALALYCDALDASQVGELADHPGEADPSTIQ